MVLLHIVHQYNAAMLHTGIIKASVKYIGHMVVLTGLEPATFTL